jgi:hypothetical protein
MIESISIRRLLRICRECNQKRKQFMVGRMKKRIDIGRGTLTAFCRRHHIRRLSLFGSTLKGTNDSDGAP